MGEAERGMAAADEAESKAGATGAADEAEADTLAAGARYELLLKLKRRRRLPMVPLAPASPLTLPSSMLVLLSVGESGPGRIVFIQPIFWPQLPLLNLFCACSYEAPNGNEGTLPKE